MAYLILSFKRLSLALAVLALVAAPSWADGPNSGPGNGGGNNDGGNEPAPDYILAPAGGEGPAATPEPATLVLLATGAAGTVIARWRKRG
jgi:hypothetical protein